MASGVNSLGAFISEAGDIRQFGAAVTKTAAQNAAAIQQALDTAAQVFIPDGDWTTNALLFNDGNHLRFSSRKARLKFANLTGACLAPKTGDTTRTYRFRTSGGGILDNQSRANLGAIGLDLRNVTMAKIEGLEITNLATGVRCSAPSPSGGAYYNDLLGVDLLTVTTGYEVGLRGNELRIFGGRVNDCTTGALVNDATGVSFYGTAFEVFTVGVDVAPTGATQWVRLLGCRFENVPTVGIGVRVGALAQATLIVDPQCVGLTTRVSDAAPLGQTALFGSEIASPILRAHALALADASLSTGFWALLKADGTDRIAARNTADSDYGDLEGRKFRMRTAYTDGTRPTAASAGKGTMIWNDTDNAPNFSDGANWRDAMGSVT